MGRPPVPGGLRIPLLTKARGRTRLSPAETFLDYDVEIQSITCSTNEIESLGIGPHKSSRTAAPSKLL